MQNTKKDAFNRQNKQKQKIVIVLQMYWVLGGVRSGDAGVQCNRTEKTQSEVQWEIHRLA